MKLFSVYDAKAECFSPPFCALATGAAIRSFTDDVNSGDPKSPIAMHPHDFVLFEIGVFNDGDGHLEAYETKKSLGSGIDFQRPLS